ncbi:hypothetical protein [Salirhabdus salicampi]|uniref:hypothetical protein n=1 Tax=Salirhabdus salicampi TaxID=476102 RepID=UPI0020C544F3|nr:hypothetical protein [Salirhabdus salicampi]MCP8615787.1 hypothetical protein [Salirhabdus salicampi]
MKKLRLLLILNGLFLVILFCAAIFHSLGWFGDTLVAVIVVPILIYYVIIQDLLRKRVYNHRVQKGNKDKQI